MSAVKSQRRKKQLAPKKFAVPKLSGHSNGQAYITFRRRRYYLGPIGRERAAQAYTDAIQQIRHRGSYQPSLAERSERVLDELILIYFRHASLAGRKFNKGLALACLAPRWAVCSRQHRPVKALGSHQAKLHVFAYRLKLSYK